LNGRRRSFQLSRILSNSEPIPAAFGRLLSTRFVNPRGEVEQMLCSVRRLVATALAIASIMTLSGEVLAQTGRASWYSLTSKTASGERCDPSAMTAAHRTLPFGTRVKVENLINGKSVIVRINDRGPFVGGRIIDLTKGAARQLGFVSAGIAKVRLTVLSGA
jgi:rare lipoprotein A